MPLSRRRFGEDIDHQRGTAFQTKQFLWGETPTVHCGATQWPPSVTAFILAPPFSTRRLRRYRNEYLFPRFHTITLGFTSNTHQLVRLKNIKKFLMEGLC